MDSGSLCYETSNIQLMKKLSARRTGLSAINIATPKIERSIDQTSIDSNETLPKLEKGAPQQHVGSQSMRGSSDKSDRITINVGGTRHETFFSTLRMYPDTRLGWIALNSSESMYAYDATLKEYFFDRHPTAFTQIINFYRTGKLHAPADICGPLFEEELQFWGLDEKSMEPCCWSKYTEHRDAQENLKVFDTPLLNPIDEELNIETMYDQQVQQKDDDGRETNKFGKFVKHLKPSVFQSIKWLKMKKKIWIAFEDRSPTRTIIPKTLSIISLVFIVMSVLSLFFHSMLLLQPNSLHERLLLGVDVVSFVWFTIEFLLRFVSSPNRGTFIISITNIVDLLSIITYPIQFSQGFQYYTNPNETIEILVSFRLFRLFRFLRLSLGLQILKHALIASSKELFLLFLLLIIPVAIFATLTYYIERRVDETKFKTIPESIWWAIITVTTVGYGDMAPLTSLGKVMGTACAICGVVILSLPVSIIGNNFSLFYHYAQARMKLPKRNKAALAGAANMIFAENSNSISSGESDADNDEKNKLPQINLGSDPDISANITSKRFRRERLSLYVTSKTRASGRRSKSMGNNNIQQRQRNGHLSSTKNKNISDSNSDTESEYQEVFKPMSQLNTVTAFDNKAFSGQEERAEITSHVEVNAIQAVNSCSKPTSSEYNGKENTDTAKHSVIVNVPETIITCSDTTTVVDVPCSDIHLQDTDKEKNLSFQKYSSPPVKPKYATTNNNNDINNKNKTFKEISKPNDSIDVVLSDSFSDSPRRKRSNNHLYPPESLDEST